MRMLIRSWLGLLLGVFFCQSAATKKRDLTLSTNEFQAVAATFRWYLNHCCFVLAVTMIAGQSRGDLLVRLTDLEGNSSAVLQPGEEINLLLSLQTDVPLLELGNVVGGVDLNTGSDAVFGEAVYLADGPGSWLGPEGTNERTFIGGPAPGFAFPGSGGTYDLGTIILRAGSTLGDYQALIIEVEFGLILTGSQNFDYSVVPEPSSALLVGSALSVFARRRRN